MGREIKRVAAGFEWPMGKTWEGFINPHYRPCPESERTCFGGSTAAEKWLDAICRFLSVLGAGCLEWPRREELVRRGLRSPHPYLVEFPQAPRFGIPPEKDAEFAKISDERWRRQVQLDYLAMNSTILPLDDELLNLLCKFAGGSIEDFALGEDARYKIHDAILKTAGIDPEGFGACPVCKGQAIDPAAVAAYEAWVKTEPPAGDWWQVWETVSEGSPVTPAFAAAAELVDYLVAKGDAWDQKRGNGGWLRANAESFVAVGWAPSLMIGNGKVMSPRDFPPPPSALDKPQTTDH